MGRAGGCWGREPGLCFEYVKFEMPVRQISTSGVECQVDTHTFFFIVFCISLKYG